MSPIIDSVIIPRDEVQLNKVMDNVFQFISHVAYIDHITYKGVDYYQHSNEWYDRSEDIEYPEHDPDIQCHGYWDHDEGHCDEILPSIYDVDHIHVSPDEEHNLEYHIVYDCGRWDADIDWHPDIGDFVCYSDVIAQKEVQLIGIKSILIHNLSGINEDHRGSDHILVQLPYKETVHIEKDIISIHDITIAFFQIKSHKFDFWYELYNSVKCSIVNDCLHIDIEFDHGS